MILENLKNKINPAQVVNWYSAHERRISSVALIFGFIIDIITLRRVDMFGENLWIAALITLAGTSIILIHRLENKPSGEEGESRKHFWLNITLQFSFGGILSAFLVFYFRSAELSSSWPFILILSVTFWANEFLRKHFARLTFQLSLFFLLLFCCFIYVVPLVLRHIGPSSFLLAGFLSLVIMLLYLHIFKYFTKEKFYENRKMILTSILGIFLTINVLYFTNIIPPIPLSLQDSGIFHSITRDGEGSYTASFEDFGWRSALQIYTAFHIREIDSAYAYSAIFSPTDLDTTVIHEWQYYDRNLGEWVTQNRVRLPVVGGREGGFRTYSVKENLAPGKWRVNVLTLTGQVVGRLRFEVIRTVARPVLETKVLE